MKDGENQSNRIMNILILIDAFGTKNFGGAGRVFYECAKILASHGNNVDVICRDGGLDGWEKENLVFNAYQDVNGSTVRKYLYYRKSIKMLFMTCISRKKYDLVIIHNSSSTFGIEKEISKLNIRSIYYFHSPWAEEYRILAADSTKHLRGRISLDLMANLRKIHERTCLRSVFGIVNLSEFMRRKMLDIYPEMESKAWRIIPGGADLGKFYPASSSDEIRQIREKLGLPVNAFIILTARRLVPRTGVDILLKAFKTVRQSLGRDTTLVICGDGVMEPELRKLSSEMDLDKHVIFTGFMTEELLPDFYRVADLFVMPTKALEGFGLATVEALACGLPVIGTDIGGTPEILGKISEDLLIRDPSVDAIAEKIANFANHNAVFPFKEKSLNCARDNFTWERHVRELMTFIKT